jgi:hypothetical protein
VVVVAVEGSQSFEEEPTVTSPASASGNTATTDRRVDEERTQCTPMMPAINTNTATTTTSVDPPVAGNSHTLVPIMDTPSLTAHPRR